jgi:hypothetical protein
MFGDGVMAITVEDLKNKTEKVESWPDNYPNRKGCLLLRPPVNLIHVSTGCPFLAQIVDINGQNPNTICVQGVDFWISIEEFEFPALAVS